MRRSTNMPNQKRQQHAKTKKQITKNYNEMQSIHLDKQNEPWSDKKGNSNETQSYTSNMQTRKDKKSTNGQTKKTRRHQNEDE